MEVSVFDIVAIVVSSVAFLLGAGNRVQQKKIVDDGRWSADKNVKKCAPVRTIVHRPDAGSEYLKTEIMYLKTRPRYFCLL